ncbi:metallophosphoesterase family protein [Listeria aquatica]|uniref:metallophosphoesterase family protein n=1 Tax=Listeria aquatica TaxID=1494960 RepID=UPI0031F4F23F
MTKIAVFSDVHGNMTALSAVLEDSLARGATEHFFLGDLLLPGPGAADLFSCLEEVNASVCIRGNWDDCFLEVLNGEVDLNDPSDLYLTMLVRHIYGEMKYSDIMKLKSWPTHDVIEIEGLRIGLSHNLPNKNYGGFLYPTNPQENFEALFDGNELDIAIFAHIHRPIFRYSNQEQLILNPGSVGHPYHGWEKFQKDVRAEYLLLEIDETGVKGTEFRKVNYDKAFEFQKAKQQRHPYLSLYEELLKTGRSYTHDYERLETFHVDSVYKREAQHFLAQLKSEKSRQV